MLDKMLQFIGNDLKVDYQRVNLNGKDWYNGYVNFFKIGQLGILEVVDARKKTKPVGYEAIANVPNGFMPDSDEYVNRGYFSPSSGNARSCTVNIVTSGKVFLGGFDMEPSYGADAVLIYKIKVGGITDVTLIVLPDKKGVILC